MLRSNLSPTNQKTNLSPSMSPKKRLRPCTRQGGLMPKNTRRAISRRRGSTRIGPNSTTGRALILASIARYAPRTFATGMPSGIVHLVAFRCTCAASSSGFARPTKKTSRGRRRSWCSAGSVSSARTSTTNRCQTIFVFVGNKRILNMTPISRRTLVASLAKKREARSALILVLMPAIVASVGLVSMREPPCDAIAVRLKELSDAVKTAQCFSVAKNVRKF